MFSDFQCFATGINIFWYTTREPTRNRSFQRLRNRANAFKVAFTRDGEAGLNHVNAQLFKGHLQFLAHRETLWKSLFTIAQGGVENNNALIVSRHDGKILSIFSLAKSNGVGWWENTFFAKHTVIETLFFCKKSVNGKNCLEKNFWYKYLIEKEKRIIT